MKAALQNSRLHFSSAVVILAVAVVIVSFLICEVYDLDVWWQLAIGREILTTRTIPTMDRWTLLGAGRPYHDSHWLFQVLIAAAHRAAGWVGVQTILVVLWGLTFAALWRLARRSLGPAASAVLLLLVGLVCIERFLPRPELVTYAALAWFLVWFEEQGLQRLTSLSRLGALQAIWTNAHGLFVLGPAVAFCYALAATARRWRNPMLQTQGPILACAVVFAATLVSPFGMSGWRYAVLLATEARQNSGDLIGSLGEMSSPFSAAALYSPAIWAFYVLLSLTAFAVLRLLLRREADASLIVMVLCASLALTGRRNVVLLAIAAMPLLARAVASVSISARLASPPIRVMGAAAILALAAYPLSGSYYLWMEIPARFGAGVTPSFFPHAATPLIISSVPWGRILASNTLGGFVSFHGSPGVLPLTDGRWEVQDPASLGRVLRATRSPAVWRAIVREFGLNGILLAHTSPEAKAILPGIARDSAWRLVYLDCAASLWLPAATTLSPIQLQSPGAIPPINRAEDGILLAAFASASGTRWMEIAALERALEFGVKEEFLLQRLGAAYIAAGDERMAGRVYTKLLRRDPGNEAALNELAFLNFRNGNLDEALAIARQLVAVAPGVAAYRENLRLVEQAVRVRDKRSR